MTVPVEEGDYTTTNPPPPPPPPSSDTPSTPTTPSTPSSGSSTPSTPSTSGTSDTSSSSTELPPGYVMYMGQMVTYSQYLELTSQPVGNPTSEQVATLSAQQQAQQALATPGMYGLPTLDDGSGLPDSVQREYLEVEAGLRKSPAPAVLDIDTEPYRYGEVIDGGRDLNILRAVQQNNGDVALWLGLDPKYYAGGAYSVYTNTYGNNFTWAERQQIIDYISAHPEQQFLTPTKYQQGYMVDVLTYQPHMSPVLIDLPQAAGPGASSVKMFQDTRYLLMQLPNGTPVQSVGANGVFNHYYAYNGGLIDVNGKIVPGFTPLYWDSGKLIRVDESYVSGTPEWYVDMQNQTGKYIGKEQLVAAPASVTVPQQYLNASGNLDFDAWKLAGFPANTKGDVVTGQSLNARLAPQSPSQKSYGFDTVQRDAMGVGIKSESMLAKEWLEGAGLPYNSSVDPANVWISSSVSGRKVVISDTMPEGNTFIDHWVNPAGAIKEQQTAAQGMQNFALWSSPPVTVAAGAVISGAFKVGGVILEKTGAKIVIGKLANTKIGVGITKSANGLASFGERSPGDFITGVDRGLPAGGTGIPNTFGTRKVQEAKIVTINDVVESGASKPHIDLTPKVTNIDLTGMSFEEIRTGIGASTQTVAGRTTQQEANLIGQTMRDEARADFGLRWFGNQRGFDMLEGKVGAKDVLDDYTKLRMMPETDVSPVNKVANKDLWVSDELFGNKLSPNSIYNDIGYEHGPEYWAEQARTIKLNRLRVTAMNPVMSTKVSPVNMAGAGIINQAATGVSIKTLSGIIDIQAYRTRHAQNTLPIQLTAPESMIKTITDTKMDTPNVVVPRFHIPVPTITSTIENNQDHPPGGDNKPPVDRTPKPDTKPPFYPGKTNKPTAMSIMPYISIDGIKSRTNQKVQSRANTWVNYSMLAGMGFKSPRISTAGGPVAAPKARARAAGPGVVPVAPAAFKFKGPVAKVKAPKARPVTVKPVAPMGVLKVKTGMPVYAGSKVKGKGKKKGNLFDGLLGVR